MYVQEIQNSLARMRAFTFVLIARFVFAKEVCTKDTCGPRSARDVMFVQLRKKQMKAHLSSTCRTALPGEACYEAVLAAQNGPSADSGLPAEMESASFEEIQTYFFEMGPAGAVSWDPADGGLDRVCRGRSTSDNNPAHYRVVSAGDLQACQERCQRSSGCKAVEFSGNRCELWLREVEATLSLRNFQCHRLVEPSNSFWDFEPVDGAVDRVCRGASRGDNKASYFEVSRASSLGDCQAKCLAAPLCTGVEFHVKGRCELWNRTVDAFSVLSGYQCHRVTRKPLNRHCDTLPCVCRTAQPGEPCYADVTWAMTEGINWKPVPGLP